MFILSKLLFSSTVDDKIPVNVKVRFVELMTGQRQELSPAGLERRRH